MIVLAHSVNPGPVPYPGPVSYPGPAPYPGPVNFPYSLPLKMVAQIRKDAGICRNCLPADVTCTPALY